MHSAFFAAEPSVTLWLAVLVNGLIKGSLLLAMAGLGALALRRSSAATRHLVWSLGLGSILLLPVASLLLPSWRVPVLPQAVPSLAAAFGFERIQPEPAAQAPVPAVPDRAAVAIAAGSSAARVTPETPSRGIVWLATIWLAGALLILARFCSGLLRLWWLETRAEPVSGPPADLARNLAERLSLRRQVALLKSREASIPLTWGVWRPAVLLPHGFERWSWERLRVVLSHELVHVKRGDCRIQMMAQLACALYWFNPLVWLAARHLRMERERACDDQVLRMGARPSDYAGHLLDLARSLKSVPGSSFAGVAMARRSQLEGRLLSILDMGRSRQSLSRMASALAIAVAICIVAPVAAVDLAAAGAAVGSSSRGGGNVEGLIADLKDKNWKVREKAAQKLARAGGPSAVEPLIEALSDDYWQVRKYAAFALVQIGDERAVEPLIQALRDSSWHVREQAAVALGQIGDPRAVEPLKAVLNDSDWHVREQATLALRRLESGTPRPGDSSAALLRDPDWRVRQQAVLAIGGQGTPSDDSLQLLFSALGDEDWHVREVTASVLGRLKDPRAVDSLIAALKDPEARVRGQAANALGLIGDRRAIGPLRALLEDKVKDVREDAQKALERLGQ